ncbi:MAG: type II 3-dehydroquinate dehydratase [Betaproteobacteria bacterium]|nr:type II 3-dehydroquinate dehydratase [Betaproteobacteria bacterium]
MKKILVIHGPNLNALGTREPDVYGSLTLSDMNNRLYELANLHGANLDCFQSNWEGAIIDRIYDAKVDGTQAIIINPGGLTHTSICLRDALSAVALPFIEVHLSNIHSRESFRHHSFLSAIAIGVIAGLGTRGYEMALEHFLHKA